MQSENPIVIMVVSTFCNQCVAVINADVNGVINILKRCLSPFVQKKRGQYVFGATLLVSSRANKCLLE